MQKKHHMSAKHNGGYASGMNQEGLTFEEWHNAALSGNARRAAHYPQFAKKHLRRAWENGEDPTEWRAAIEKVLSN